MTRNGKAGGRKDGRSGRTRGGGGRTPVRDVAESSSSTTTYNGCVNAYHILDKIGEGCFGKVYKGRKKNTSQIVALKFMTKRKKSRKELSALRREVQILRKLNHRNIILLLDYFETKHDFCVVTELAQGTNRSFSHDCVPVGATGREREWGRRSPRPPRFSEYSARSRRCLRLRIIDRTPTHASSSSSHPPQANCSKPWKTTGSCPNRSFGRSRKIWYRRYITCTPIESYIAT